MISLGTFKMKSQYAFFIVDMVLVDETKKEISFKHIWREITKSK